MLSGKASAYRIARLLALVVAIILLAAYLTWPPQPEKPGAVAVTFLTFTNVLQNGHQRTLAVFSVTNLSDFQIRPFGISFQKQGQSDFIPADYVRNSPVYKYPEVIDTGDSATIAVAEPNEFSEDGRRQFCFVFVSDRVKDRLKGLRPKVPSTNKSVLRIGRILDDPLFVVGDSAWVENQPEKPAPNQKNSDLNPSHSHSDVIHRTN